MKTSVFQKIIKDSQAEVKKLAEKNNWLWFYKMHQTEVISYAEKLLKTHKKASKEIVLISCWLHDIAQYCAKNGKDLKRVKKEHHINGAKIAEKFLQKYELEKDEIDKIKNCILRHRNSAPYLAKTLEEKIVAVADTLSHFGSIFYLTYFKFQPDHSLETMAEEDLAKIKRDWRDLRILPEARKMVKTEYEVLRKLLENYNKR